MGFTCTEMMIHVCPSHIYPNQVIKMTTKMDSNSFVRLNLKATFVAQETVITIIFPMAHIII